MNLKLNYEPILFDLPDASIEYFSNFFDDNESDLLFNQLKNEVFWQQDDIKVYGKIHKQPRLTSLYGNEGKSYSYSSIKMNPHSWSPLLNTIKSKVEAHVQAKFTTVLINLYRDGKDSNGWHADNERELGNQPTIASVSFGYERVFQLKHNSIPNLRQNIVLQHGSLLVMKGNTQHYWKHQIPKTSKTITERINLTFRDIKDE